MGDICKEVHPGNGGTAVRRFIQVMGDSCRALLLGIGGAAVRGFLQVMVGQLSGASSR